MRLIRRRGTGWSLVVLLVAVTTVEWSVSAMPAQLSMSPVAAQQISSPPTPDPAPAVQPPKVAMPALPPPPPASPTAAQLAVSGKVSPGPTPDPAVPSPTTAQVGALPQGAIPTVELSGARTDTSKTFATASAGQFVSQAYSGPINYRGADGILHDVDPSLVQAGAGRFKTKATAVGVDLAASPNDANLAVVSFDTSHSVGFGLAGAAAGPAAAPEAAVRTAGNASTAGIVHRGILPGVDLILTAGATGLQETLVLASPSAPASFVFPLHLTGLTASVDTATGDVVYRDAAGTTWGRTPRGFMVDSKIRSSQR